MVPVKARIRVDPASASHWIGETLKSAGATLSKASDPTILPRAIKNAAEIKGTRAAHLRDGAAVCRFLAWLVFLGYASIPAAVLAGALRP